MTTPPKAHSTEGALRETARIVAEQGDRILATLAGRNRDRLALEDQLRIERVRELLAWLKDRTEE